MQKVVETSKELPSRASLRGVNRVLVKAGTSVVANEDGRPSLTRLGAIVEQIAELNRSGVEVIFVSSGAVGMGKRLIRKQTRMNMSFMDLQNEQEINTNGGVSSGVVSDGIELTDNKMRRTPSSGFLSSSNSGTGLSLSQLQPSKADRLKTYDSVRAATGQFEMTKLYSSLFDQCDVTASQILLTQADFQDQGRLSNLTYAVDRLLSLGIIPIINENDAVSANKGYCPDDVFSDNDSLAALCARSFGAEVCLLLTDVNGVYDRPPSEKGSKLLSFYAQETEVEIGKKSNQGRGGMAAKIGAAVGAVAPGSSCGACLITSGSDLNCIRSILSPEYTPEPGEVKGTLFATPGSELENLAFSEVDNDGSSIDSISEEAKEMACASRTEARKLQAMSYDERKHILYSVADALIANRDEILAANAIDLEEAERNDTDLPLVRRLKLTDEKLATLAGGIKQIADQGDPLGVVQKKRELANDLELSMITVPIGVLMIIFESRPDSLPQISALALASGNGLILKGGKEAACSNEALHNVIGDAVESASGGKISRDIIALITSRGQVSDLLKLDDVIDLVIPRGGNSLVSYIKANTKIPVLGHADGVCHVYVDSSANAEDTAKIVVDAKTDYPSACNAMETLLLHSDTLANGLAMSVMMKLRLAGVKCLGGPTAMNSGLCDIAAEEMKCEYGDLTCMVEVVDSMDTAIDWIHKYGSGHTEAIVCSEGNPIAEEFLKRVDAACVFSNASTRFADGYRFGLGAEVGISTGRIHARGPVGVEGLLTSKWQLRSKKGINYVGEFGGNSPAKVYTHKELSLK